MSVNTDVRKVFGGRITIFKQGSPYWNARFYRNNGKIQTSLKTTDEAEASRKAEAWYLSVLTGKQPEQSKAKIERVFPVRPDFPFSKAIQNTVDYYTQEVERGERSSIYLHGLKKLLNRINVFLGPSCDLRTFNQQTWNDLIESLRKDSPITHNTVKHYKAALGSVFSVAMIRGDITTIPQLILKKQTNDSKPKVWFTAAQYQGVLSHIRKMIKQYENPKTGNSQLDNSLRSHLFDVKELYLRVMFGLNSGLRPEEISRLKMSSVTIVKDGDEQYFGEQAYYLELRNFTGKKFQFGQCQTEYGAAVAFHRILELRGITEKAARTSEELVFKHNHRDLFKKVLRELKLYTSPVGKRDLHALRHSYACHQIIKGEDIRWVAANMRSSVQMLEKSYLRWLDVFLKSPAERRKYREIPVD